MIKFAAIQLSINWNKQETIQKIIDKVVEACLNGAQVIVLQELIETPYFCKTKKNKYFQLAYETNDFELIGKLVKLAKEYSVVIPVSYFEKDGNSFFNSLLMIDADGTILGKYRKSHIPDGPGYDEKYYFAAGDTGFKVWQTKYGKFGVGICWDQWFPEQARILTLMGAEAIFYPTAIGSEPDYEELNSKDHWQRVMQGHSAANMLPIIAANRVGVELDDDIEITFYGSSFITDYTGKMVAEASLDKEEIIYASLNLKEAAQARYSWGLFRDRRIDLYSDISEFAL